MQDPLPAAPKGYTATRSSIILDPELDAVLAVLVVDQAIVVVVVVIAVVGNWPVAVAVVGWKLTSTSG